MNSSDDVPSSSVEVTDFKCAIEKILQHSFSSFPYEIKKDIVSSGKPTPDLNIRTKTRQCLYCWPCLLFSSENFFWTQSGFCDLNNFHRSVKRDELSKSYLVSCMSLKQFVQITQKHNENVKKNRHILGRLLDVTCFLAKQELAFRGHDGSSNS
ncbi:hypothetical protein PR048_024685 [Dryococelus australis]|uniref:DUF4371 domain-containing protein n=1 Tax=Dryococelus australis TaxID=614101 RepID=A0ABQ9GPB4_9NEOP|nr:hypothetical protein PR048_024685 [Dryococelus australis]